MVGECYDMEQLGKHSVQCIEIAESWEFYDIELMG